eukprot:scaffold45662_cov73-Cyclotella_meneghiniana.AAC.3
MVLSTPLLSTSSTDEENQHGGSSASALDISIALPGLIKPDVVVDNTQSAGPVILSLDSLGKSSQYHLSEEDSPVTLVRDARAAFMPSSSDTTQEEDATAAVAASSTFNQHGFCCLSHKTKVQTWNEDYIRGMLLGSDISRVYKYEIEYIVRNILLRQYNVIEVECPAAVLKRGPGSKNNFYGSGVHQDFGLTLKDYLNNMMAYDPTGSIAKGIQNKFDNDEVRGAMVINFWRPIGGYTKENPLLMKPLAVCDPSTVDTEDTFHYGLDAKPFGGREGRTTDQMGLKPNSNHKWYYYPQMTDDEVLVFKQLEVWKTDMEKRENMPVRGCFHSAIDDPNTPIDTLPRSSTEFRVLVYIGKETDTNNTEQKTSWSPPAPLWPKSLGEWGMLVSDMGSIGMIPETKRRRKNALPSSFLDCTVDWYCSDGAWYLGYGIMLSKFAVLLTAKSGYM